jgi:hypothetical protein
MSAALDEPIRLKERRDHSNLIERVAAQALRDLPRAKPLSGAALARIEEAIDSAVTASSRPDGLSARLNRARPQYAWVFVTAAFVLGVAAAASAERLGVLPRWLTQVIESGRDGRAALKTGSVKKGGRSAKAAEATTTEVRTVSAPAPVGADLGNAGVAGKAEPQVRATIAQPQSDRVGDRAVGQASSQLATPTGHPPRLAFARPRHGRWRSELPASHEGMAAPVIVRVPASSSPLPTSDTVAKPAPALAPPAVPATVGAGSAPILGSAAGTVEQPGRTSGVSPQATQYLTEVVRSLRVERSPEEALRLLDRYARELAGNSFSREALLLRVEAMLALGRRGEVLRLLDGSASGEVSESQPLLLTRGQLRAEANRCAESVRDFSLVLTEVRRPPKAALLGRALCRKQLGDHDGALVDVERYRREFPGDPAVDEVVPPRSLP